VGGEKSNEYCRRECQLQPQSITVLIARYQVIFRVESHVRLKSRRPMAGKESRICRGLQMNRGFFPVQSKPLLCSHIESIILLARSSNSNVMASYLGSSAFLWLRYIHFSNIYSNIYLGLCFSKRSYFRYVPLSRKFRNMCMLP